MTNLNRLFAKIPFAVIACMTCAVLALALYGGAFANEFVMDDEEQIINNRLTESFDYLGQIFSGASTGEGGSFNSYGVYFRPLMLATFLTLRSAFGLDPVPFHVVQLLFHIGASVLLALLLRQFFSAPIALIGAAFFLIHPMNVEAVSYIACLQDPMCAFFSLSLFAILARRQPVTWPGLFAMSFVAILALLAKETAVLYFFALLAYTALFRRREFWRVGLAIAFAGGAYFTLRAGVAGLTSLDHDSTQLARESLGVKLLTLPAILTSYLTKLFFPIQLATTQDWVIRSVTDLTGFVLPAAFVITVTGLCLWYLMRTSDQVFLFFFVWAFAGLGFHSHLLAALDGTVAERWFYMPCMGLIGMLCALASRFITQPSHASERVRARGPRVLIATLALFGIGFAVRTILRTQDWRDGYTLYTTDLVHQPDSAHLQNNVGVELFRRGQIDEAKSHFEKSIALHPGWKISWNNLGAVYHRRGNLQKAEDCYRNSISKGPYLLAYRGLYAILLSQHRTDEANSFLKDALKQFPADPELLGMSTMQTMQNRGN